MSGAAGYILKLDDVRREVFEANVLELYFAEPVPEFTHSRHSQLVCFVERRDGFITHLASGKRGHLAGTDLRRLNLFDIEELETPVSMEEVVALTPSRLRWRVTEYMESGGLLPPKSFEAVVDALMQLSPQMAGSLRRYSAPRRRRIEGIPGPSRTALAYQKEAVATALAFAGISRSELQDWDFDAQPGGRPDSYLDGLPQLRMREDQMLMNDLASLPGYDAIRHMPHPAVVFESGATRLTVVLANRLRLEEQLGVDLIYYNETYRSFVMVQYKAMDSEVGAGALFRLPDAQLATEVGRMDEMWAALSSVAGSTETDGFRLCSNPFFLKLCPRVLFDPDNAGLVSGMYLPLDYWKRLSEDERTLGPRGGRYVSYENATRYFDNTSFVTLVTDAWIGTEISHSEIIEKIVREVLEIGRTVVLARKSGSV